MSEIIIKLAVWILFWFLTGKTLIISHNGASGDYPGCTDLAYEEAVKDGADIIDCSAQMTKDGVAFCLDTADLMVGTNAVTQFMSRSSSIPEIQPNRGIFSFDLTWSEIKNLKRTPAFLILILCFILIQILAMFENHFFLTSNPSKICAFQHNWWVQYHKIRGDSQGIRLTRIRANS